MPWPRLFLDFASASLSEIFACLLTLIKPSDFCTSAIWSKPVSLNLSVYWVLIWSPCQYLTKNNGLHGLRPHLSCSLSSGTASSSSGSATHAAQTGHCRNVRLSREPILWGEWTDCSVISLVPETLSFYSCVLSKYNDRVCFTTCQHCSHLSAALSPVQYNWLDQRRSLGTPDIAVPFWPSANFILNFRLLYMLQMEPRLFI